MWASGRGTIQTPAQHGPAGLTCSDAAAIDQAALSARRCPGGADAAGPSPDAIQSNAAATICDGDANASASALAGIVAGIAPSGNATCATRHSSVYSSVYSSV